MPGEQDGLVQLQQRIELNKNARSICSLRSCVFKELVKMILSQSSVTQQNDSFNFLIKRKSMDKYKSFFEDEHLNS